MEENKKIKERIKTLFAWRDILFAEYSRKVKEKTGKNFSANSLSHKLSRESISFKEVLSIADELGYDIIFKPRNDWK